MNTWDLPAKDPTIDAFASWAADGGYYFIEISTPPTKDMPHGEHFTIATDSRSGQPLTTLPALMLEAFAVIDWTAVSPQILDEIEEAPSLDFTTQPHRSQNEKAVAEMLRRRPRVLVHH